MITRIGSRAYTAGDESDPDVVTDGTTTYYALSTPTETETETASLVCENGEAPMTVSGSKLVCDVNEGISSVSGYHDAKIKYTKNGKSNYSQKIQIYVERKPS